MKHVFHASGFAEDSCRNNFTSFMSPRIAFSANQEITRLVRKNEPDGQY